MNLPKTIDNDVEGTDMTFGYDTAMQIATEAIDRLHTTATSHHRIIVCEIMGHKAGWLTLSSGIAGGADVILIPEIPYDLEVISKYLLERRRRGSKFSIIAVAEGAISKEEAELRDKDEPSGKKKKAKTENVSVSPEVLAELVKMKDNDQLSELIDTPDLLYHLVQEPIASRIARKLQEKTGIDARVTSLGRRAKRGHTQLIRPIVVHKTGHQSRPVACQGTVQCHGRIRFRPVQSDPIGRSGRQTKIRTHGPSHDQVSQIGGYLHG